jgi:hypothetical protein
MKQFVGSRGRQYSLRLATLYDDALKDEPPPGSSRWGFIESGETGLYNVYLGGWSPKSERNTK